MKISENMTVEELKMLYELKCHAIEWKYVGILLFESGLNWKANMLIDDIEKIIKPLHSSPCDDEFQIAKGNVDTVKCNFNPDLVLLNGQDVCSIYNKLARNESLLKIHCMRGNDYREYNLKMLLLMSEHLATGILIPENSVWDFQNDEKES